MPYSKEWYAEYVKRPGVRDRLRAINSKYKHSAKGTMTDKTYRLSEDGKERARLRKNKYRSSEKGMATEKRYYMAYDKNVRYVSYAKWLSKPGSDKKLSSAKRVWNLRSKYGITVETYDKMLAEQNGVCAICGKVNEHGRRLAVDHNHATGKVRGLLCGPCNRTVGNLRDSAELASKTADYIRKHEGI